MHWLDWCFGMQGQVLSGAVKGDSADFCVLVPSAFLALSIACLPYSTCGNWKVAWCFPQQKNKTLSQLLLY